MERKIKVVDLDERRKLVFAGDEELSSDFAAKTILEIGNKAIEMHGYFAIALSGGLSPLPIYQKLSTSYRNKIDWKKVFLFWGDERSVPPTHPENNFRLVMEEGGLNHVAIKENVFRMQAEEHIEENSIAYEKLIREKLKGRIFDLVMGGIGEDGHTASLFPNTEALHVIGRLVTPNFVSQKNTWRMTLTFQAINQSDHILLYVQGKNKSEILTRVLKGPYLPDLLPSQRVGTPLHPALLIIDDAASKNILSSLK